MPGGVAFADILDEKVGGFAESGRIPWSDPSPPPFVPPNPFLFATPHRPFRTSPYRVATAAGATHQRPVTPRPAPVRPARTLTSRQHRALDAFVARGAFLAPDFTAGELRSAFRMLALTYHPDRHPDTSDTEKARLTRVLADLNEHHRQLLAAAQSAA